MKLKQWIVMGVLALLGNHALAQGLDQILDPEFKDSKLRSVFNTFNQNGSLQLDEDAVASGPNEWDILVTSVTLPGSSQADLDTAWKDVIKKELQSQLNQVRQLVGDAADGVRELNDETMKKIAAAADISLWAKSGLDDADIKNWIMTQITTKAARNNCEFYLSNPTAPKFEFFRFHRQDTNSEVIGEDVLLIRGLRRVIRVQLTFTHA